YVLRQDLYSSISAQPRLGPDKKATTSLFKIVAKPVWKFVETYIVKAGFLDGILGFITAIGASYASFLKQVKIWEINHSIDHDLFK
ncbi:MAG: hypothetical protein WC649_13115, partial [Desulfobacteria bacterium]